MPTLVDYRDAIAVDWRQPHPSAIDPITVADSRRVVAWVMSPPGVNSGGHQNIFRFMKFLEDAGHEVRIYLYSMDDPLTPAQVRDRVSSSSSYAKVRANIQQYPKAGIPDDVHALFATSWETAYRSYRDPSRARRFYFVQDFEPLFYPMGSEAVLAENTYRFGFYGITAGKWLATRLTRDYGMRTASYDFGADPGHYNLINRGERSDVFFYARPETARRGFELGVMALDLFARDRPDHRIVMAGQDVRNLSVGFDYVNAGSAQVGDLNSLYNECAAGLVLSLSNMSLLPLELLAAGAIPVVNDGENNRLVSDNPFIAYTLPIPRALADRLIEIVDRPNAADYAVRAAASVSTASWEASGVQFLEAFERGMSGR
ncbi:rhamnosyltransferase WsaF family glycosyltransferase [Leifsonella bigeumensis]|uniref:rhamnosyltransferase WsaF family glycosyltransferase n=1 Tax=Leifsonella bigeumensis TaxID=433643 RepID=UPI0031D5298A